MSIRALAKDVYAAQQKVGRLQIAYDTADVAGKTATGIELKVAQKELDILRRMLSGEKESGEFRKRFSGFGNSKF